MFLADKEWIILEAPASELYHRLAQAIRRGCEIAPTQAFYKFSDGSASACVTQAARLGGFGGNWDAYSQLGLPFPCGCHFEVCRSVLPHLNDVHRWSREHIADWLEGLNG
jgi:hypothetical protein